MTSLLRDEVALPMVSVASITTTSRPAIANARAAASPTTPAPITTASTVAVADTIAVMGGQAALAGW